MHMNKLTMSDIILQYQDKNSLQTLTLSGRLRITSHANDKHIKMPNRLLTLPEITAKINWDYERQNSFSND